MSVLRVKNGNQWDIVPAIKGDTGDPAADESITDAMLVPDGIKTEIDWLWGNQLTKELSGELMQASDTYGAPMLSLGVDGKSTQAGTPTPENPVPIVSVDSVELMLSGMNIFDKVYASDQSNWRVASYRSIRWYVGVGVPVTFSYENAKVENLLSNSSIYFGPRQGTASGNMIMFNPSHHETSKRGTAISGANGYVYLNVYPNSENAVSAMLATIADVLQIEVGSTAHSYAPYTEEISTVPLYDGTLRSLPDGTKDTLALSYLRPSAREGWAWYSRELVKKIDTHTFNGSETWTGGTVEAYNGTTGTNRFNSQIANLRRATQVPMRDCLLSDVLIHTSTSIWSTPDNYIWYTVANDNQIHIVFDNVTIGVTSETAQAERTTAIRAWLDENPITIHYPLATPITETLDPIELPIMPSQTVNVWSDPATNLKMTYIQDSNLIIENLEATIADIATS